jgi:predicted ATP-dependent Lon-type protease
MKMELKDKILQYFEGKVVRKDLTSKIKEWIKWSNHVLEYLLEGNTVRLMIRPLLRME